MRSSSTRPSKRIPKRAKDSGVRETGAEAAGQIVARLYAATRAREGERVELQVDVSKAHVFDPATGANLTYPESAG